MKFLGEIQSKLKTAILSGLVGLIGIVVTALYKGTAQAFVDHIIRVVRGCRGVER